MAEARQDPWYCNCAKKLFRRYYNIKHLENLSRRTEHQTSCRVAMVEFPSTHNSETSLRRFEDFPSLCSHLHESNAAKVSSCRRVYVMENLSDNYVELLGSHFAIDPFVFACQIQRSNWEGETRYGNTPKLLSCRDPSKTFSIWYNEVRVFDHPKDGLRDCISGRGISFAKLGHGYWHLNKVGVIRRVASFWSRGTENGGWEGQLLARMT